MMRESGSRPQDPDDRYAGQEAFSRRTIAEADFPVYGVGRFACPATAERLGRARAAEGAPLHSEALAAFESCDGELSWVEVRSGDWTSADGPYLSVRTYRPGAEHGDPLPELEDVVEDERDRLYEQLGIDEGDGPGVVRALREWITVEGEPRALQIHEDRRPEAVPGAALEPGPLLEAGAVWAGRLRLDGLTVTVCGRGVPPGAVELARIEDFERYILGRTELMRRLAARRGLDVPVEERELAPAVGLEAHRELIEHNIAESMAIDAQVRARRTPRLPRRLRGEVGAVRWEAAVRQQMRLASETREEAAEAVAAMVNHLTRLARNTDWAVGTPDGRDAVEEVVRYTVFASEVPSLPAQRAWEQLWNGGPDRTAEDGPGGAARRLAEQVWLSAWEQWRLERSIR
ncbi:hypothetical protein [Streptomyces sp. CB03911]|uniref:hypothetical protein n=1 Tax=Streptomycetaceae TaxID=2062 RepID=UPI0018FED8BA|nr:hypothetical protein [Streptomyces sp. CB03911]